MRRRAATTAVALTMPVMITGLGATAETAPCSQSTPGANLISFGAVLAPVGSSAVVRRRPWAFMIVVAQFVTRSQGPTGE
jgi:hypothetical protein